MKFEIKNGVVGYRSLLKTSILLDDINIKIDHCGFYVFCGLSGSGKSTLVSTLIGLTKPINGQFLINDKPIQKYHIKGNYDLFKNDISYVPTSSNLISSLTLKENLGLLGIDVNEFIPLLQRFKVEYLLPKTLEEMSKGEGIMSSLAIALFRNTETIIFDEPTGALDVSRTELVFSLLKEASKNRIIIVISHDQNKVNEYADVIYKIDTSNKKLLKIKDDILKTNEDPLKPVARKPSFIKTNWLLIKSQAISEKKYIFAFIVIGILMAISFSLLFVAMSFFNCYFDFEGIQTELYEYKDIFFKMFIISFAVMAFLGLLLSFFVISNLVPKRNNDYALYKINGIGLGYTFISAFYETCSYTLFSIPLTIILSPIIIIYILPLFNKNFIEKSEIVFSFKTASATLVGVFLMFFLLFYILEVISLIKKRSSKDLKEEN